MKFQIEAPSMHEEFGCAPDEQRSISEASLIIEHVFDSTFAVDIALIMTALMLNWCAASKSSFPNCPSEDVTRCLIFAKGTARNHV